MAVKYKNENNIYAWRDSEGHWVFSKEADINTDNYLLKSTTSDKLKPYSPNIKYVTKENTEVNVDIVVQYPGVTPDKDYEAILTSYATAAETSANAAKASSDAIVIILQDAQEVNDILTNVIG